MFNIRTLQVVILKQPTQSSFYKHTTFSTSMDVPPGCHPVGCSQWMQSHPDASTWMHHPDATKDAAQMGASTPKYFPWIQPRQMHPLYAPSGCTPTQIHPLNAPSDASIWRHPQMQHRWMHPPGYTILDALSWMHPLDALPLDSPFSGCTPWMHQCLKSPWMHTPGCNPMDATP